MIDETFVEKIVDLAREQDTELEFHDIPYSTRQFHPINPPEPAALEASTLGALRDYLNGNPDDLKMSNLLIRIGGPSLVEIESKLDPVFQKRKFYLKAKPLLPDFQFGSFMPQDKFMIGLAAAFVRPGDDETDNDFNYVARIASHVKQSESIEQADDGISQRATLQNGVKRLAEEQVKSVVALQPYRTFTEVEQVLSKFILRMRPAAMGWNSRSSRLMPGHGAAWRWRGLRRGSRRTSSIMNRWRKFRSFGNAASSAPMPLRDRRWHSGALAASLSPVAGIEATHRSTVVLLIKIE